MNIDGGGVDQPPRILWILSVDPANTPDGQSTYSVSLIRAVAATGAAVTVLHLGTRAPSEPGDEQITWRPAGTTNRNRVKSIASRLPAMAYTAAAAPFRRALAGALEQSWDAVVVDHVQSGWAVDAVADRLDGSTLLVHVSHNQEGEVRRRVATGTAVNPASRVVLELDARKVAALERRVLRRTDLLTCISEDDARAFTARAKGRPLVLSPGYAGQRVAEREITAAVPRCAVVAGSMRWRVKQFDLLELLRAADGPFAAAGAEIMLVGDAPAEFADEVRALTTATRMVGHVDSFAEPFAQARLALLSEPHGGGFKLKTLDYVFHRVPMLVLAGSVRGLPLEPGHGLLEYSSIDALVRGGLEVIDDLDRLNQLQREAYERCADAFDWADRGARLQRAVGDARPLAR